MRLSSKAHYGLLMMVGLAQAYRGKPVSLSLIAQNEGLSLGYLEQLVLRLRKVGLVESTRGIKGGYRLTTLPCLVTIGKIVRALEGPVAPIGCASESSESPSCQQETRCFSRQIWQQLRDSIVEVLDSTTLADLCSPLLTRAKKEPKRAGAETSLEHFSHCNLCSLVSQCPGGK